MKPIYVWDWVMTFLGHLEWLLVKGFEYWGQKWAKSKKWGGNSWRFVNRRIVLKWDGQDALVLSVLRRTRRVGLVRLGWTLVKLYFVNVFLEQRCVHHLCCWCKCNVKPSSTLVYLQTRSLDLFIPWAYAWPFAVFGAERLGGFSAAR